MYGAYINEQLNLVQVCCNIAPNIKQNTATTGKKVTPDVTEGLLINDGGECIYR